MTFRHTQVRLNALRHVAEAQRKFAGLLPHALALSEPAFEMRERVAKIEALLRERRDAEAILVANVGAWHDVTRAIVADLKKANFDPDEARDDRSKEWIRLGSDAYDAKLEGVQYRGYFHDIVVDDLINGLNKSGGKAIKNIHVLGLSGIVAIPDGASLPDGWTKPYFIEVKTGQDPEFTPNHSLICLGGHAISFDTRIRAIGLTPGQLLPPLDIMIVYTQGPNMPITFHSYCLDLLDKNHAH